MPRILRKYALTAFLDIGIIVRSISLQIAIDNNQGNRMFTSCYMEGIYRDMCRYRAINAINSPIIIIDSGSKGGTC